MTKNPFKHFKNKVGNWVFAFLSSFFIASFLYIYFFQTPLVGKRELSIFFILCVLLVPILYFLNTRVLLKALNKYSNRGRIRWVILSILLGLFFTLVTRHPTYMYILLPQHTLDINLSPSSIYRDVSIEWFNTSIGDKSFSEFQTQGVWKKSGDRIEFSGNGAGSLYWEGKVGENAQLIFNVNSSSGLVNLAWDNKNYQYDFSTTKENKVTLTQSFTINPFDHLVIISLSTFFIGYIFLTVTLILNEIQVIPNKIFRRRKFTWLFYALPMIGGWGIYFLTFYPGIITPDAVNQWDQIITRQFNDALPVTHTLIVLLITRFWLSPAAVIVVQILSLSLTVAWGISILDEHGLPRWAGWVLVVIFALSPVNGKMVVTLWKDILYSTFLLLLSLMVLKVVFSRGAWLQHRTSWLWLGFVSLGISSFRLNGLPVPFFTLIILAVIYRFQWKPLVAALVFFISFFVIIQGPVYNQLHVDRKTGFKQLLFMHHISAHIVTGGPLTPQEETMASRILPIDEWAYDCCTNIRVWYTPSYSEERFAQESDTILRLFLSLLFREPRVEANHMICVSSLIWGLPSQCKLNHESFPTGQIRWISPNGNNLKENSLIPTLVVPLSKFEWVINQTPVDILFYTPALYLYLAIYCTALFAFRNRSWKKMLFVLPATIQSAVMLLINVSRDFRYQYGVFLIGLFSLGLLVLAFTLPVGNGSASNNSEKMDFNLND
jgi:hypothetical protein